MVEWLLLMILFGIVVGAIARFLVPGPDPQGWLGTMALGIVGSFVGGLIYALTHGGGFEVRTSGFVWSILGAIVVVLLQRLLRGGTRVT